MDRAIRICDEDSEIEVGEFEAEDGVRHEGSALSTAAVVWALVFAGSAFMLNGHLAMTLLIAASCAATLLLSRGLQKNTPWLVCIGGLLGGIVMYYACQRSEKFRDAPLFCGLQVAATLLLTDALSSKQPFSGTRFGFQSLLSVCTIMTLHQSLPADFSVRDALVWHCQLFLVETSSLCVVRAQRSRRWWPHVLGFVILVSAAFVTSQTLMLAFLPWSVTCFVFLAAFAPALLFTGALHSLQRAAAALKDA